MNTALPHLRRVRERPPHSPWLRLAAGVLCAALVNVALLVMVARHLAEHPIDRREPPPETRSLTVVPPPPSPPVNDTHSSPSETSPLPKPNPPPLALAMPEASWQAATALSLPFDAPPLPPTLAPSMPSLQWSRVPPEASSAPATELDEVRPERLFTPNLTQYYPRRATRRGIEGRTRLQLRIDGDGTVTDVEVLESTPEGVFEAAAKRAAMHIRYQSGFPETRIIEVLQWRIREP